MVSRLTFSRLATGASVVYFDYSGCGRSDRLDGDSEYSISLFARNIEAVRQHTESESIDLVGLSSAGFRRSSMRSGIPAPFGGSC